MRIDAHTPLGRQGWKIWHAEQCRHLYHVVWVDDVTAEWCQYEQPWRLVGDTIARQIHKARAIQIMMDRRFIVINPVTDDGPAVDLVQQQEVQPA